VNAEAEAQLVALAATQLGLFTLQQAFALGITRKMVRTRVSQGAWARVRAGVYIICGHRPDPAVAYLAAVLAAGASARASHRAAARLWEMTPFEQKPEITLVTSERVRLTGVRVHRTITPLSEPDSRRGVPTTTAAETLLDLGGVLPLDKVRDALDRGIAHKVLTPMSALAELNRRGGTGVRGTAHLRALLDDAGLTGSHRPSELEAKTRRLIQKAGLPQPRCELIVGNNGEYRLDFCWPELLLAIEVDGWMYHSSFAAFHGNKTRKNSLVIDGYSILEYTWKHVTQTPSTVMREISAAYSARRSVFVGH
jgi:hypothetical protein